MVFVFSGVAHHFEKAKAYFDGIFASQYDPKLKKTSRVKGSLLICGSSRSVSGGSGRTSVAHAVCSRYEQAPYFAHVEVIECTSLRGKLLL